MSIESINPATGQVIETFEPFTTTQIDQTLARARAAYLRWRTTSFAERAALLHRVASLLRVQKADLGRVATLEMGKTLAESQAEVEKCAWNCDYYAENGEAFLAPETIATNAADSYVQFTPLGVVLAIMPWNFPYWKVMRFAAPAIMAGNAAVLKHASNVTRCGLEIERIFREAGAPDGLFTTIIVPGGEVEPIISDPRIAAVTLTGSTPAGMQVAGAAGRVIKKTVLELGGSDAFIVLADADLDAAAEMAVRSRFQNAGQSCIAAKRFIVEESVADAFTEKLAAKAGALRVGDPLDAGVQMGPMARADLRDALVDQVERSVALGARIVLGGSPDDGTGAFFPPTVVTDVTSEMPLFREETFGPVAAVIRARDADHAVELANDSIFGLGGNLWTSDLKRARAMARQLESGAVFINGMTASDPRLPFGGVKQSGYGRELSSFGIREFVNIQTVWIGPAAATPTASASATPASAAVTTE